MKAVYIILTDTGTILSRIIKIIKRTQYNHASISLDENLKMLYSFGRINPYIFFWGAFVKEGIDIGTFKRFKNTKCLILKLNITEKQYQLMKNKINYIVKRRKQFKFNNLGLIYAIFNKKKTSRNSFFCSEFVKYILEAGEVDTNNIPEIVQPEHLLLIEGLELVYKGLLRNYTSKELLQ